MLAGCLLNTPAFVFFVKKRGRDRKTKRLTEKGLEREEMGKGWEGERGGGEGERERERGGERE